MNRFECESWTWWKSCVVVRWRIRFHWNHRKNNRMNEHAEQDAFEPFQWSLHHRSVNFRSPGKALNWWSTSCFERESTRSFSVELEPKKEILQQFFECFPCLFWTDIFSKTCKLDSLPLAINFASTTRTKMLMKNQRKRQDNWTKFANLVQIPIAIKRKPNTHKITPSSNWARG